jgi:hypothetical protein
MSITLSALQKQRTDTAANWTSANPTLLAGEIGIESDTGYWKVGDGSTVWNSLAYLSGLGGEIPVSRLADGSARQLLQTAANGNDVEWTSNVDIPGTLDVTGAATFDNNVIIQGDLTVNGTETIINTQTLDVEDKNIVIGKVTTPSDVTADGGGITLKGTTDKTISWIDATDAWTFSEHVNIASAKEYRIAGTKVLDATSLGSAVVSSSLTSVGTIGTGVWQGTAIADTYLATISTAAKVSNSATTATSANTNSAIVARDGSGNFSAGTITAALTGAASSNVLKAGDTMTGALVVPLASASAPSLTFTGDTNTGIYSPGADQLAISTNGTGRLFINSAGNAVIGSNTVQTFTGYTSLTLDNATNGGVLCINKNAVNIANISATNDALSIDAAGGGSSPIVFRTGAATTERLRITAAGLVGVGTSSPNVPLQVIGGSTVTDPVIRATNSGATQSMALTSAGLRMDGGVPIQIYQGGSEVVRIDTSGRLGIGDSGPDSTLTIKAAASTTPLRISGPSSEFARIDSSGNFGIASSGNLSKLTVNSGNNLSSTALVAFNTQNANINGLTISNWTGSATTQGPRIAFDNSGNSGWIIGGANGNAGFDICQSWGTPLVRIDGSGRVAIGTTSPFTRLDVRGTSETTDSTVQIVGNSVSTLILGQNAAGGVIRAQGGSNALAFWTGGSSDVAASGSGTERARIDSSGRLLVGTSTALNVEPFVAAQVQTEARYGYASIYRANDAGGPALYFIKSRAASAATVVQSGDVLGEIRFQGADGGDYETPGGTIKCEVDGTPGANDMPGRLVFSTTADGASSPTERMRISNTGILYHVSTGNGFMVSSTVTAGTGNELIEGKYSGTAGTAGSGTTSFRVFTNGNVQNTNNSYTGTSDIKLKENIVDATSQWNDLKALQVRKYNFKEGQTHTQIGLIAQEVELISPGLVSKSPDRDEDGNDLGTVTKSVNYSVLYMKAVKALQEAIAKIETLEGMVAVNNITIDEQQHQLSTLAARLTALESA